MLIETNKEKHQLKVIEDRLSRLRHSLEVLVPLWSQVDRRMKSLQLEVQQLEEQRLKLTQGQMILNFDDLNF